MFYLPRYRQLPPNFRPPLHPCFILITHTRWGSSPSCGASDPPPGARLPVTSREDFPVASHCCLTTGWFLENREYMELLLYLFHCWTSKTERLNTSQISSLICYCNSEQCTHLHTKLSFSVLPFRFSPLNFISIHRCELYVFCHAHVGFSPYVN